MRNEKNILKWKVVICVATFITLFLGLYNLIIAEDSGDIPNIVWHNVSDVIYVTDSAQNFTCKGSIQNYNANIIKVVWTTTEYANISDALTWAQNETVNCAWISNAEFTANLNNFTVSEETKVYFYLLEIDYEAASIDGAEANNVQKIAQYRLYNPYVLTFVLDEIPPTVTGINANEQVSNYWFIKYARLNVTVQAEDTETNVSKIKLYVKKISRSDRLNGVPIETIPEEPIEHNVNDKSGQTTFNIDFQPESYEYIISASAIDANNNESARVYLTDSQVGVVYENSAPQIIIEPEDEIMYQNGNNYFDKEHKSFVIKINDDISGIKNLSVEINGISIANQYGTGTVIKKDYTDFGTYDLNIVVNTSQVAANDNGKYEIKVLATDHAENTEIFTKSLYIDDTAPEIANMDYNGNTYDKSSLGVVAEKYENFSDENSLITIKATDGTNGSGVKSIKYYTRDITGNSTEIKMLEANQDGEISFELIPDFKGFIYATAVDNLGNEAEEYVTMSGLVLETQETHAKKTHVAFNLQVTSKKDNQGNPLYSNDTNVSVTVNDEFAGIKTIAWSVTAPNDSGKNKSGTTKVASDGTLSNADWEVTKTDLNLITEARIKIPITHNSNDITIKIMITDNVGNVSEKETKISMDKTAPDIQIKFDETAPDATYTNIYNSDRVATITVKERNFSASLMNKTISNSLSVVPEISSWRESKDVSNPDNTTYTATISFTQDGDYTVAISGTDLAGNQSKVVNAPSFTIDQTVPVVSVAYSQQRGYNENFYATDRIVTISVKERNFAPERISLQGGGTNEGASIALPSLGAWIQLGDTYTTSIVLRNDGVYEFSVATTDKAGNLAIPYQSERFIIDKTVPEIVISNVEDKSSNNKEVAPVICLSDTNLDLHTMVIKLTGVNSGVVELDGWYSVSEDKRTITFNDFLYEQSIDDLYVLEASVADMAGNMTIQSISFSVNRYGSVYILNKELKEVSGMYVQNISGLAFTELNVDSLLEDTIRLVLTVNGVPTTLSEGIDYAIDENGDEGSWRNYTYKLEDKLFENDGTYILTVYSVDRAGNINQNTDQTKEAEIQFGVDNTAPVVVPINIASEKTYNESVYNACFSIKDNLVLDHVEAYINGEIVAVNEDGENFYFDIPESNDIRRIQIVAFDAAGNETECILEEVLITTNFFVRWYNNRPVFWTSIVIGIGAISVFTILFVKKKNHNTGF